MNEVVGLVLRHKPLREPKAADTLRRFPFRPSGLPPSPEVRSQYAPNAAEEGGNVAKEPPGHNRSSQTPGKRASENSDDPSGVTTARPKGHIQGQLVDNRRLRR